MTCDCIACCVKGKGDICLEKIRFFGSAGLRSQGEGIWGEGVLGVLSDERGAIAWDFWDLWATERDLHQCKIVI